MQFGMQVYYHFSHIIFFPSSTVTYIDKSVKDMENSRFLQNRLFYHNYLFVKRYVSCRVYTLQRQNKKTRLVK